MAGAKGKLSVYFPGPMIEELEHEARRLERSLGWLVEQAWRLAVPRLRECSSAEELDAGEPPPRGARGRSP